MTTTTGRPTIPTPATAADLEGIVRCGCGAKYWDDDPVLGPVCHSCGGLYLAGVCPECGTSGNRPSEGNCIGCGFQLQWDVLDWTHPVHAYDDKKGG